MELLRDDEMKAMPELQRILNEFGLNHHRAFAARNE